MTTPEYRFHIEAVLRVCCGFSKSDFEALTWAEAEDFVIFYRREISNNLKLFAFRNLESSRLAYHGKKDSCNKYLRELIADDGDKDNNLEDQFAAEFGDVK